MPCLKLEKQISEEFLSFLNSSKSNYAAVVSAKKILGDAGYQYISEGEDWSGKLKLGGKYYTTRNQSSIMAFAVGGAFDAKTSGFNISAAHTDSPCLKVKPVSKVTAASFLQVGVECYGGGLWHTWFDRDLGLSGRVLVREGEKVVSKVIEINKPIMRIPTLAIHLNRSVNDEGFKFNKEEQLLPIISTAVKSAFEAPVKSATGEEHHSVLLRLLAEELQCKPEDIENFDLSLSDTQPAVLGGANSEFIFGGRLDNLMMSFVCLHALRAATTEELLKKESQVQMAILFDNEEIGSDTAHGAGSTILQEMMQRIAESILPEGSKPWSMPLAIRKSFLFSCDMAHGLHPNYRSKHESNHAPLIHSGAVIKENANARYATTVETKFLTRAFAKIAGVPTQPFVVRNDSLCGSTIGPILAAKLGLRCVDIGIPQFSMHSIREMAGTADLAHSTLLLQAFYTHFSEVDKTLVTDRA
jgi:aspartyl aminopeptidase